MLHASREANAEIFRAVPFSYGTGGFLLSATLRVVRAKKFVKLQYRLATSHAHVCEVLSACSTAGAARGVSPDLDGSGGGFAHDFVDGLVFAPDLATVITGAWTDGTSAADRWLPIVRPWAHWWRPLYYAHVKRILSAAKDNGGGNIVYEELMPASDYLFRYDRGCFWTLGQAAPRLESAWVRFLFGWALTSRLFHLLPDKGTDEKRSDQVVQDATVAIEHGASALDQLVAIFGIYPLWLCPCLNVSLAVGASQEARNAALVKLKPHRVLLDIGVYGKPRPGGSVFDAVDAHRKMEGLMHELGGFLFSYAICFSTRREFWERWYDSVAYARFRKATGAEGAFPDLFDKIGGGKKVAHLEKS